MFDTQRSVKVLFDENFLVKGEVFSTTDFVEADIHRSMLFQPEKRNKKAYEKAGFSGKRREISGK